MIEIATVMMILEGAGYAKAAAEFIGLVESLDSKVDRILKSKLGAGLDSLGQFTRSPKRAKRKLESASNFFTEAVQLERGIRYVTALLGRSLCHRASDDEVNARHDLDLVLAYDPIEKWDLARAGAQVAADGPIPQVAMMTSGVAFGALNAAFNGIRALTSNAHRKDMKARIARTVLDQDDEIWAIAVVQKSVSKHLKRPVAWMQEFGIERIRLESEDEREARKARSRASVVPFV